jgi:hypothetical protein
VHFAKCSLGHNLIHFETAGFLVVGRKMLDCRGDSMRLDRIDICRSELASEEGIIT